MSTRRTQNDADRRAAAASAALEAARDAINHDDYHHQAADAYLTCAATAALAAALAALPQIRRPRRVSLLAAALTVARHDFSVLENDYIRKDSLDALSAGTADAALAGVEAVVDVLLEDPEGHDEARREHNLLQIVNRRDWLRAAKEMRASEDQPPDPYPSSDAAAANTEA